MDKPASLTILHSFVPTGAVCWRDFEASENGAPVHVCVANLTEDQNSASREWYDVYSMRRLDILKRALTVAQTCPVILYTGLVANHIHAPCGCYGYDVVCDYHRHGDDEVAGCFCSDILHLKCVYHTALYQD